MKQIGLREKNKGILNMTEGNTTRLLLVFALPMLLGNLFQQLYNIVDCSVIGNYEGSVALAAVGATGSLNFLFFSFSNGMGNGIGIVAAQYFGAKDEENVKRTIANSVYVVGIVALVMSALGAGLAYSVLHLMRTPEECMEKSITYMRITCGFSIATVAYNTISALLRALGDSRTPLIFLVVASFLNIGLDLLLVLKFGLGVAGVAIATVIAQSVAAGGSIFYAFLKNPYFQIPKQLRKPKADIIRRSFRIGVPIASQSSMIALSCICLQVVINGFGDVVVAANTALTKIEQVVQQPFGSLSMAISTFTGQNLGAGKMDRVKKGFWVGTKVVAVIAVVILIVAQLFAGNIIGIFTKEDEVIALGSRALHLTSCFYFMLGMIYVTRGTLNGVGDNAFAMINGVTELGCRIGFAYPLTSIPFIGKWGIWITTGATWFVTGGVNMIRYASGRWMKSKNVREHMEPTK